MIALDLPGPARSYVCVLADAPKPELILFNFRPVAALCLCALAGCSGAGPGGVPASPVGAESPSGVRTSPVVAGRRARVFIMAGFGANCEPMSAPQITVTEPPAKGSVTFEPGQQTTVETSASGTCLGKTATGTGIYYTARPGETGADRFAIAAKLASGETATRSFSVEIVE